MGMLMGNKQGMSNAKIGFVNSGKYMMITSSNEQYYTSNDFGATFTLSSAAGNNPYYGCGLSSDGQYQVLGADDTQQLSIDYGVTWNELAGKRFNVSIAYMRVSDTYQYMVWNSYVTGKNKYVSNDYGVSFFSGQDGASSRSLGMSRSGQYMLSAKLDAVYLSTTYGASWSTISTSSDCGDVSGDGNYVVHSSTSGILFISSNSGVSFTEYSLVGVINGIDGIKVSHTGQYMIIQGRTDDDIWRSDDYGATWVVSSFTAISNTGISAIAISGDGKYVAVGEEHFNSINTFSLSTDYGATFTRNTNISAAKILDISIN